MPFVITGTHLSATVGQTPPCSLKSYLFSLLLGDLGDTIPSCLQQDTHITTRVCMKAFISAYTTIHTHISLLFTHPAGIYSCLLDDNPWLKNIPYNFYPDSSLLCYVLRGVLEELNKRWNSLSDWKIFMLQRHMLICISVVCVCYVQYSVVSKLTLTVFNRIWPTIYDNPFCNHQSNSWT